MNSLDSKNKKIVSITAQMLLVLILVGCAEVSPITAVVSSPTQESKTAAPTKTTSITETDTPTPYPTYTRGATWTPRPIITLTPTRTPYPKMSLEEAESYVLELFASNGGCEIPCLWGIVPGVSDQESVVSFLRAFSERTGFTYFDKLGGSVEFLTLSNGFDLTFSFHVENGIVNSISIFTQMFRTENGVETDEVLFGDPEYQIIMGRYLLSNILSEIGPPSEVLFRSFGDGPVDFPSETILFYFETGLSVKYTSPNDFVSGIVRTCPWESNIVITTWDPKGKGPNLVDFKIPPQNFRVLADVTEYSPQTFYELFKEPTAACIETDRDIWPLYPGQSP